MELLKIFDGKICSFEIAVNERRFKNQIIQKGEKSGNFLIWNLKNIFSIIMLHESAVTTTIKNQEFLQLFLGFAARFS